MFTTPITDISASVRDCEPSVTIPMTGEEYLESLRDDREIWIYGERVKDVTQHPAFRNCARMVARLYDAMHDSDMNHPTARRMGFLVY
ncbi:4-hydroxyphenylacetate 3-monooxygenase oxygenase component [Calothrix sp. NIES-4071]|nr:4-hydroxyphenylacetate 3-monooxygenase oxygenase component [Calothrix sp. NIES-4071]BAZ63433.1 4-hydroxyphenylacetate 3-monooxygenase oxygenase component [Calothrix sp. NIES-4105]